MDFRLTSGCLLELVRNGSTRVVIELVCSSGVLYFVAVIKFSCRVSGCGVADRVSFVWHCTGKYLATRPLQMII